MIALGWQIKSDEGWSDIKTLNKTIEYEKYIIKFKSGNYLECADEHIIITKDYEEVFAKDSLGKEILTEYGIDIVTEVINTGVMENMYDFTLADDTNHLYYTNGILSHNTTLMTIYALWLALFFSDQTIYIMANKKATATMIFGRIGLAYKELPNWLKETTAEYNKTNMTLSNGSKIITAATTADGIRGDTVSCIIFDELAFVDSGIEKPLWDSITPTLATNPNAKLFVASTPNGVGNLFYQLVQRAEKGESGYKLEKVIWSDVPGRDAAWKERTLKGDCNGDIDAFEQEYECRFLGISNSPFPTSMFTKIEQDVCDPIMVLEDGCLEIWKKPENNRVYSIGVDISEGIGLDASVIQVFDFTDLSNIEQVARYTNRFISPTDFTTVIYNTAKMYGFPVLAIERNNMGLEVCERIFFQHNYNNFVNYGTTTVGARGRIRPGILSTSSTKYSAILTWKFYAASKLAVKINDKATLDELRHFIRYKNEKFAAASGYHDDLVMAMAWAFYPLHVNLINDYFIVREVNQDKTPKKILGKFFYAISDMDLPQNAITKEFEGMDVPVFISDSGVSPVSRLLLQRSKDQFTSQEVMEACGWQTLDDYWSNR